MHYCETHYLKPTIVEVEHAKIHETWFWDQDVNNTWCKLGLKILRFVIHIKVWMLKKIMKQMKEEDIKLNNAKLRFEGI
jgi:hypothetical protein